MKTRIKILATLSAVLLPAIALATFKSPSELLTATYFKNKPINVSYEAHADTGTSHLSAWLKGQVQIQGFKTSKANLQLTYDTSSTYRGTSRMTTQIRVTDGVMYLRVQDFGTSALQSLGGMASSVSVQS